MIQLENILFDTSKILPVKDDYTGFFFLGWICTIQYREVVFLFSLFFEPCDWWISTVFTTF